MLLSLTGDAIITAAAGIITSFVIAGGAFYGVVYNARQQRAPRTVKVDPAELDRLEADVARLTIEVARWRAVALDALTLSADGDAPE